MIIKNSPPQSTRHLQSHACGFQLVFAFFACWMMLLLGGCTPAQQAYQPDVAARSKPILWLKTLQTSDGTRLPLHRWWHQPTKSPEAIIIALHGFNDYGNAFALPAQQLNAHNIAVIAFDQRGFGVSPQHGIWANNNNLQRDVVDMVRATAHAYPKTPLYLLGESMGGAVAITTLARHFLPELSGVILSAPALWGSNAFNPFYRATLWTAAHSVPYYTLTGKHAKVLASDNIPMLIALGKDPHVIKATRIDAIYGLVSLMDDAHTHALDLTTPTLLLYGQHDQVIPAHAIATIGKKLNPSQTRLAYYPKGFHMLLRDLHANIVLDDVIAWIHHPNAALPSGNDKDWQTRMAHHKGRK